MSNTRSFWQAGQESGRLEGAGPDATGTLFSHLLSPPGTYDIATGSKFPILVWTASVLLGTMTSLLPGLAQRVSE
jgi:hypothetical protein